MARAEALLAQSTGRAQQSPDKSTDRSGDTAPSVENENTTTAREIGSSLSAAGIPLANSAAPKLAGATKSGSGADPVEILTGTAAAHPPAARISAARDRKSDTAGKTHAVTPDRLSSSAIHAGSPPHAAATSAVAAQSEAPAPSPNPSMEPLSSHGKAQSSGSNPSPLRGRSSSSALQSAARPGDPSSAAGTAPNHSDEAAGAAPQDAADLHASMLKAQSAPGAAVQPRSSEGPRSAAALAANGQHVHTPAGPALAPIAGGTQSAQSPEGPGLSGSAVAAHLSSASSEASRSAAPFERMDAAAPPRIIESSPQNLAVGIHDAGLGWIEIRTHAVAGQVAATLASGSHEAHAAIAAELPAIRDMLMSQHVALHSLGAEQFPASSGGGSGSTSPDSGGRARQPLLRMKGDTPSAHSESEGESLSYISVRV
ncbi:MAG: hypothetical protein WBW84_04145 [Acidobacteriaceae bacterium]